MLTTFSIWDTRTGKLLQHFQGPPTDRNFVYAAEFSADAAILFTGDSDGLIHAWDWSAGKEVFAIPAHPQPVMTLAVSPDGRTLASGGGDGHVHLWELATRQERRLLAGHTGPVKCLAFSPDSRLLASGSDDTTVRVWNLTIGDGKPPAATGDPEVASFWKDLADPDAHKAYRALWRLAQTPDHSARFMEKHLRPAPDVGQDVSGLINDLDNNNFQIRASAMRKLAERTYSVESALRQHLKKNPSPESQRRIEELQEKLNRHPDRIRMLRAIEVLERLGTAKAKQLLKTLTTYGPESPITKEATASLQRLAQKGAKEK